MIANLDPASEMFLADLERTQQRLAEANRQVSSGKKIAVAADAPDQIGTLLQLRADLQQNAQMQFNLELAGTDAAAADNALTNAVKLMDRALVLASQGANSTSSAGTRASIAQEIEALHQQMVAASQTTDQGRYIFSGDQDDSPAYEVDLTQSGGVTQLSNAQSTRQIQDPAGGTFSASMTAQQIFDTRNPDGSPAGDNVFAALDGLRTALLSNDTDAVTDSIAAVKQASDHLSAVQSFYGSVQNRIQAGSDFANSYAVQLKTEISQKEDADVTAAALELTQGNTQLQAAFQMRARMPNSSLFDYLG